MKKYTWKELRKIQRTRDENYYNFLRETPEKYRLAFALALSIVKWERSNPGRGCGYCPLCDLGLISASPCPLSIKQGNGDVSHRHCYTTDPPHTSYGNWIRAKRGSKEKKRAADTLYNMLVACYREEYARL